MHMFRFASHRCTAWTLSYILLFIALVIGIYAIVWNNEISYNMLLVDQREPMAIGCNRLLLRTSISGWQHINRITNGYILNVLHFSMVDTCFDPR
jgi:hypothetical protein